MKYDVERRDHDGKLLGAVYYCPSGMPARLEGWHASFPGDDGEPCIFPTRDEAIAFMDQQIAEAQR